MNGEVVVITKAQFLNPKAGWEDLVQENTLVILVDQIPNELQLSISSPEVININLTRALIEEISNMERKSQRHEKSEAKATEVIPHQGRFNFVNEAGIEVIIGSSSANEFERDDEDARRGDREDRPMAGQRHRPGLAVRRGGRRPRLPSPRPRSTSPVPGRAQPPMPA